MENSQLNKIRTDLIRNYESLENPNFNFVQNGCSKQRYNELLSDLLTHFLVKDTTNVNQDVSFVYRLVTEGGSKWIIQLSMIGSYGVLFRLEHGTRTLVCPSTLNLSSNENLVLKLLHKHGVMLLSEGVLIKPLALKLFYTEPENVRLYQALFSDVDILPWSKSTA